MWICRKCNAEWEFSQVNPSIDKVGCYFRCPTCNHRNTLVAMQDGPDERTSSTLLMQPDLDWPDGKPWR